VLTNQTIDPNQDGQPKPFILLRPFMMAWNWLVPPTQAHRDRQSKTARLVAISTLVFSCLGLVTLGFIYARPVYNGYQDWQAENLYKEAKSLANDGQYPTAFAKIQEAVTKSPDNINAIRMNAEFLTMAKRPESIFFLDQLDKRGVTTDADRQMRVRALVNLQRSKEASVLLEKLLEDQKPNQTMMKLAEDIWGKSQKDEMLKKAFKNFSEKHPEDRQHNLRLASVLVKSEKPSEVSDGIRQAWMVAAGDDDIGLQAIELLDTQQNLPPDESKKLIQRLRAHPKSTGWHLVAALSRQLVLEPLRKNALIEEAALTARGRTREDLVPLVRWLIQPPQNEYHMALALVSEDEAKSYKPLLENYLTALTMLHRYDDLERLVKDPKVNAILSHSVSTFFRAHLCYVLNKSPEETRSALIGAKEAASIEHQSDLLEKIAKYSEDRGHNDIAEEAYRAVAINPQTERIGFLGLIRTTEWNGNTQSLIDAAGEAVRRWPDDSNFLEHYLYASLLAGRQVELGLMQVKKLQATQPNDQQRKLLVALAYWRLKDLNSAFGYLNNMDLRHLTPGQQAVFAAIARDSGVANAKDAAKEVVIHIDPKARMLPEERACFSRALR
jgi:thioredoxin-like negative regulator of GroEL